MEPVKDLYAVVLMTLHCYCLGFGVQKAAFESCLCDVKHWLGAHPVVFVLSSCLQNLNFVCVKMCLLLIFLSSFTSAQGAVYDRTLAICWGSVTAFLIKRGRLWLIPSSALFLP